MYHIKHKEYYIYINIDWIHIIFIIDGVVALLMFYLLFSRRHRVNVTAGNRWHCWCFDTPLPGQALIKLGITFWYCTTLNMEILPVTGRYRPANFKSPLFISRYLILISNKEPPHTARRHSHATTTAPPCHCRRTASLIILDVCYHYLKVLAITYL